MSQSPCKREPDVRLSIDTSAVLQNQAEVVSTEDRVSVHTLILRSPGSVTALTRAPTEYLARAAFSAAQALHQGLAGVFWSGRHFQRARRISVRVSAPCFSVSHCRSIGKRIRLWQIE